MGSTSVLRIMVCYKIKMMEKNNKEFEIWLEACQDQGNYPDDFDPNLYDL